LNGTYAIGTPIELNKHSFVFMLPAFTVQHCCVYMLLVASVVLC
jgi:hypothetical protein